MSLPTPEDPFPLREVPPRLPTDPPKDLIVVRSEYLLNIESIRVKRIVGTEVAYIYGSVEVDTCHAIDFAYNRESAEAEMKMVGDFLTLTGPNAEHLGSGFSEITLDLYDAKHDGDHPRKKLPFASGVVNFILGKRDFSFAQVNRRLSRDISGKWGTITLNYSILDRAIAAYIKILVICNDELEEGLEVFGTVSLDQVVRVTGTTFQLKLFDHPNVTDTVKVIAGGVLPLERHIVPTPTAVRENALADGAPLNPKLRDAPSDYWNPDLPQLVFHVDLWAKGYYDDEVFSIASGVLEFNVKPLDRIRVPKEQIIVGNNGRKVLVSFTCFG